MAEILSRKDFDKAKVDVACDTAVAVSDAQAHRDSFVATIEALAGALTNALADDWSKTPNEIQLLDDLHEKGWL